MKIMRVLLVLFVILTIATPLKRAAGESEPERSTDLLEQFTGFDESLIGEFPFVVYIVGRKAGHAKISVGRASDGAAVYQVKIAAQIEISDIVNRLERTDRLDEKLALVSSVMSQTEFSNGSPTVQFDSQYEMVGNEWRGKTTRNGKTWITQFPVRGLDHGSNASIFMVCRKAGLTEGRVIHLGANSWVRDIDDANRYRQIVIQVGEAVDYELSGESIDAFDVAIEGSDHLESLVVGRDGKVLEMQFGTTVRWIAGTEGPDDSPSVRAAPDTPQGAITLLYRIAARLAPVDSLDTIVDWESCYTRSTARDPFVTTMALADFKAQKKREVERNDWSIDPGLIGVIVDLMVFRVEGDEATVASPEEPEQALFRLRRTQGGAWKLMDWR